MKNFPIVCSVSGGKSSAYIAANYNCDYYIFAIVRIEDQNCKFPDEKYRKKVEDRLQKPFIGTAEMDKIIYTIFDLEQYLGQKIHWVSGPTFDKVVEKKGGMLPSPVKRYCTTNLKILPMANWAFRNDLFPQISYLGFRAGEENRAVNMREKTNKNGIIEQKVTKEKHKIGRHKGNNKWEVIEWQKPKFPLIVDRVFKEDVNGFWKDKKVRFAELNNCVGCFHRNPMLLNKLANSEHRPKMQWFSNQEGGKSGEWKTGGITYEEIMKAKPQIELDFDDFSKCDTGYCGL